MGDLLRIAVVFLEPPNFLCSKSCIAPRYTVTINLLYHVTKESEAAMVRNSRSERTEHLRREILSFIYDYMSIKTFPVVGLKFVEHASSKITPVVRFSTTSALPQVVRVEIEQFDTYGFRDASRCPADTLCGSVVLRVCNAMLLDPLKSFVEKFHRTL